MTAPSTPDVQVLGAGKAGTAVALGLARAGRRVRLVTRRRARWQAVEAWCAALTEGCGTLATLHVALAADDDDAAEITIVATPDGAVGEVAAGLGSERGVRLHLSGLLAADAARGVSGGSPDEGVACGAMHPLAAIPDAIAVARAGDLDAALEPLRGALFVIDGDAAAVRAATGLATALGGRPVAAVLRDRAAYHAAAAIVANDLVALLSWGERLAVAAGLEPADARRGLVHLAGTALRSVQRGLEAGGGLADGLTGAVGRGDHTTLAGHLAAAARAGELQARAGHAGLSAELVDLLEAADRLDPEAARRLRATLDQPGLSSISASRR